METTIQTPPLELTSENVEKIFLDCLFQKAEDSSQAKIVEGIRNKFGFNPEKLEKNKEAIISLLNQLPDDFKESVGEGGMSFLNACVTNKDDQWGEHSNVEQLICLGMAIDKVQYVFPKEIWIGLPGGMPYIVIKDK